MGKTGITTGADIDKIMKSLFKDRYIGMFEWRSPADVPKLEEGQVAILNKAVHWTAAYAKNGKLYEIDSYNRDLLGAQYKDDKVPASFQQPFNTTDCGQRTITMLIKYFL